MSTITAPTRFRIGLFVRTFIGLVVAPTAGAALVMAIVTFATLFRDPGPYVGAVGSGALYGFVLGGPAALVLGWPVHLLMLKLRWTNLWAYLGIGGVLGVFGFALAIVLGWAIGAAGLAP